MLRYFLIGLFLNGICLAQEPELSGIVLDKTTGEPVIFAHVYLANTTRGTTSEVDGRFVLRPVPTGQFTLVCTMVGYESYLKDILLMEGKSMKITIELVPSRKVLNEMEFKGEEDRKWKRQYSIFERELLGETSNAVRCEIMNPWVVDFETKKFEDLFSAHADQPLIIQNRILGYQITFLLKQFEIKRGQLIYIGFPSFEALKVDDWDYVENFLRNREDTFQGSTRHFFYALIQGQLEEEGFKVYRATGEFDADWPNRLSEAVNGGYLRPVEASEILIKSDWKGNFTIYSQDLLEIHYTKRLWSHTPYTDAPYEVSRIRINDPLMVARHGYVFNPYSFVVYGYLAEERVANMLPYEYGSERLGP